MYTVDSNGCWLWQHSKSWGYGYVSPLGGGTRVRAHRFMYEKTVGPIAAGMTLDHLCRVRHCVNPAHLEPVTIKENTLRGNTVSGINAKKTHCVRGHALSGDNLRKVGKSTSRSCKACVRIRNKEHRSTFEQPTAQARHTDTQP